jgi:SAM-dependent methyltransferase
MPPDDDYLLGHSAREWDRLTDQHSLWRESLLQHFPELNGRRVLELGCGSGALLAELSELVGPFGEACAIERDAQAAATAREQAPDAEVWLGDIMEQPLGGPYDLIVVRWVLSFLPDPATAIRRAAAALRPGGQLIVQDYNHDGVRVFPGAPAFDRAISAYRTAYAHRGGDLWVGAELPRMFREAGLTVEHIDPQIKAGPPHSPTWRWVERFVFEHLHTITTTAEHPPGPAHLSRDEVDDLHQQWSALRDDPGSLLFSPIQVCVVGTRP